MRPLQQMRRQTRVPHSRAGKYERPGVLHQPKSNLPRPFEEVTHFRLVVLISTVAQNAIILRKPSREEIRSATKNGIAYAIGASQSPHGKTSRFAIKYKPATLASHSSLTTIHCFSVVQILPQPTLHVFHTHPLAPVIVLHLVFSDLAK